MNEANFEIELNFINKYDAAYDSYEAIFINLFIKTIQHLNLKGTFELSVTLVDDQEIHYINKEYRNIDRITDVISFENEVEFAHTLYRDLGDVFIAIPQALRQAKEYGNTDQRELSFLFIHGLLHCLGYDHCTEEDEKQMFELQEVILDVSR